jgi:hypothetical protein
VRFLGVMVNIHGLNDYKEEVSNGYKPDICPISGQRVVIPCTFEDDEIIYDYFTIMKALYDVPNGSSKTLSPITGKECVETPKIIPSLFCKMRENPNLKDWGKNFKFSRNSLLRCVQYLCSFDHDRDYIIRQYGLPNYWDVSNVSSVENLFSIFKSTQYFDYDISNWDLSGVKNLSDFSHMFYGNIGMKNNFIKDLTVEQYQVILDTGFENNPHMRDQLQDLIDFHVNIVVDNENTNINEGVYSNTRSKVQKRLSQEELRQKRILAYEKRMKDRTNVEEQQAQVDVVSNKKNGDTKKKRSFFGRNPFKKK